MLAAMVMLAVMVVSVARRAMMVRVVPKVVARRASVAHRAVDLRLALLVREARVRVPAMIQVQATATATAMLA